MIVVEQEWWIYHQTIQAQALFLLRYQTLCLFLYKMQHQAAVRIGASLCTSYSKPRAWLKKQVHVSIFIVVLVSLRNPAAKEEEGIYLVFPKLPSSEQNSLPSWSQMPPHFLFTSTAFRYWGLILVSLVWLILAPPPSERMEQSMGWELTFPESLVYARHCLHTFYQHFLI